MNLALALVGAVLLGLFAQTIEALILRGTVEQPGQDGEGDAVLQSADQQFSLSTTLGCGLSHGYLSLAGSLAVFLTV